VIGTRARRKILFVESYAHVLLGQQRTLLALLRCASAALIEPVVAVTTEGAFCREVASTGTRLLHIPYPDSIATYGGAVYRTRGLRRLRMLWQVLRYVASIRSMLRREKPDAVFCNDMRGLLTAGVAARSLGIPVTIWDKLDQPHGWLDCLQLPLVQANIVISNAVCTKYPGWQTRWFSGKIEKIPDGADLKACDGARSTPAGLPGEPGDILLAIVGSICHRKGHDRVLGIWPELVNRDPRLRLLVVGAAPDAAKSYADDLPNRNHPRVHFLGELASVLPLMHRIDVLLAPSRHEGQGLVIVEAMACSVPVIAARAGGIPEVVVDGKTGLLFDGDAPEQLVDAVLRLAASRELRRWMGTAAREVAEAEFSRPVQMRRVLNKLLAL
jgi:glycosyltransferase involved in cell wall biosynthesis